MAIRRSFLRGPVAAGPSPSSAVPALRETWAGANGAAWPTGWTTFGDSATIQDGTGQISIGGSGYESGGGGCAGVVNGELLFRWRWTVGNAERYFQVTARAGSIASTGAGNGYILTAQPSTNELLLRKGVAGTYSTLAVAAKTFAVGTWFWARFRWVGAFLQARVWVDGIAEPDTWDVEATDTSHSAAGSIVVDTVNGNDAATLTAQVDDLYLWAGRQ